MNNKAWVPKISENQLKNAKLYSSRENFVYTLSKNIKVLEIGTGGGDYADFLLKNNVPSTLDLLDTFNSLDFYYENYVKIERFNNKTHLDYIKNKFKKYNNVNLLQGNSLNILPTITQQYDYIYIDADHTFDYVVKDLEYSSKILNNNGIIGLNDYSYKPKGTKGIPHDYDVIPAVNQFLYNNKDWHVIAFALDEEMYCDIYIQKI